MNSFFEKNTYIVNQKVWTIANSYKIEDEEGKEIGLIQEDLPFSRILLRMIMNKGMTPFTLNIVDSNQKTLATAKKKFSFMKAAVELLDGNGQCIGFIKQKFTLLKPEYEIQDSEGKAIGKITGNWVAWDYKISDLDGNEIATISKKFNKWAVDPERTIKQFVETVPSKFFKLTDNLIVARTRHLIEKTLGEDLGFPKKNKPKNYKKNI